MGSLETINKRGILNTWQKRAHADKGQELCDQIAVSQLTAAGAADNTALPCRAGQTGVSGGQAGWSTLIAEQQN